MIDVLEDTLTRRLLKMRRIAKKKKRNGNYTMLNMVQKVAVGIAKGLQYLHENGVILRDLKVRIFFRASLAYELGLHFRI